MFKCLIINLLVFLIGVNSNNMYNKPLFLPNLPFGEYRINFLSLMRCSHIHNKIVFNFYLSKKSANTTEIKGNLTNSIPVDDSIDLEINMAVKDTIGNWQENAFKFKKPKMCTLFKLILGDFPIFERDEGVHNATRAICPLPVGFHKLSGVDTSFFILDKLTKTFFYGIYKLRFSLTKNDDICGCFIIILEIKRPWETD